MLHGAEFIVLGNVKQDEQGRFVKEYARKFEGKPNIREAERLEMVTKHEYEQCAIRNRRLLM
jgi:hypothetical protein